MHALNKRFLLARLLREAADPDAPPAGGAPAADTGAASPPAAEPQNTAPSWRDSIQDDGLKAFLDGKGFENPGDALKALQDLEGKTVIPESAEAYQLPVPEGQDGTFATEAAKWMHEAGVPVAQAQALAEKWNAYQAEQAQAADLARQQQGEADVAALRKEWGGQYDANLELGRRAVRAFVGQGEDAGPTLEKIESALGAAETFRLFHRIGKHLGEGTLAPEAHAGAQDVQPSVADLFYPSMKK